MNKYKCKSSNYNYEHVLKVGKVYSGIEKPGIFVDRPFLVVYDDEGNEITTAHLNRFERVMAAKDVIYSESTNTWRIMPQNYMLFGHLPDEEGRQQPYVDHAVTLDMVEGLRDRMPESIYCEARKVVKKRLNNT